MDVQNTKKKPPATKSTGHMMKQPLAEPAGQGPRQSFPWSTDQAPRQPVADSAAQAPRPLVDSSTDQRTTQPAVDAADQAPRPPVIVTMEQRVRKPAATSARPAKKPAAKPASRPSAQATARLKFDELKQWARQLLDRTGRELDRVPRWALAVSLVAVLAVLVLLARAFTRGSGPAGTSQSSTAKSASTAVLKPLALKTIDAGAANYRQVTIHGLSYADGKLSLLGTVRMPKDRYSDQSWQVLWVSDDVVGRYGLDATDGRIAWYPVTGQYRKEDAESVLATWSVTSDTRCVLHIRINAKAGSAQESVFAKFDTGGFRPTCIR